MNNKPTQRFPDASTEYQQARQELLAAEQQLRQQVETVAAMRRRLPAGQLVSPNYDFTLLPAGADTGVPTTLADLFTRPGASLMLYSFMYATGQPPCPMCTAFLDSLNGTAPHLRQHINLAVVAKCDVQQWQGFRDQRGWDQLSFVSSLGTDYNADYWGELANGQQLPMLNVFKQTPDGVRHHYTTEMFFAETEPGQHPRHMDMAYPLWNLMDFTPEGRPADWFPQIAY